MKTIRLATFGLSIFLAAALYAGDEMDEVLYGKTATAPSSPQSIESEIKVLRQEVARLREENQKLRRLLASHAETSTGNATGQSGIPSQRADGPATINPPAAASNNQQETGYWMTTSSHKRHNSKCRYYKTSNGRSCGPDEGIPCKICGG